MLVSKIMLSEKNNMLEIQGQVTSSALDRPFVLWWRFPRTCEKFLDPSNGDPFLPALLVLSMRVGEPLEIEAPVSSKLMSAVPEIQKIYRSWDNDLSEVTVNAPVRKDGGSSIPVKSPEKGLFFSGGVDSSYTLFKNYNNHPKDEEALNYLVMVHGFDIRVGSRDSGHFRAALASSQKIAQALGKNLLPVVTNIRDISDRFATWGRLFHGAAMASIGLSLEKMFSQLHISAHYESDKVIPRGAHPELDPLWSTEYLNFIHDGLEASRLDKIKFIAQYPIIFQTLRVCWANFNKRYNCGRCEKCLRTMTGLYIAGVLDKCETFPHSIDVNLLRAIPFVEDDQREFVQELVGALGYSKTDLAIKTALEERLSIPATSAIKTSVGDITPLVVFRKGFNKQAREYFRRYGLKRSLRRVFKKI